MSLDKHHHVSHILAELLTPFNAKFRGIDYKWACNGLRFMMKSLKKY